MINYFSRGRFQFIFTLFTFEWTNSGPLTAFPDSAALPAAVPLLLSRVEQLQDKPTSNLENSSLSPATFWEIRQDVDDASGCVSSLSCTNLHFLSQLSFTLDKKNPQRNVQPNPAGWAAACTPFPFSSFHFDLAPLVSFFCAPFSPSQPAAFGVKKVRRVAFCHVISTRVNSHKVLKVTALYLRKKTTTRFSVENACVRAMVFVQCENSDQDLCPTIPVTPSRKCHLLRTWTKPIISILQFSLTGQRGSNSPVSLVVKLKAYRNYVKSRFSF